MRIRSLLLLFVVLLALLSYRELRPTPNSITLDVRDMPIREVIGQIEKQARIPILIHKDVDFKVTLTFRNKPLEEALALLVNHADANWASIYSIYSSTTSQYMLQSWFQGHAFEKGAHWSNVQELFGSGSQIIHAPQHAEGKTVTLQMSDTPASEAAIALSKAGQAHVLLEDGINQPVQLKVKSLPLSKAVSQLASQLNMQWTHFYIIQERPKVSIQLSEKPGERVEIANHGDGRSEQRHIINRNPTHEERKRLDALKAMSPTERREFLASEMRQKAQNRFHESLRNGTPEQRIDRLRRNMNAGDEIEIRN